MAEVEKEFPNDVMRGTLRLHQIALFAESVKPSVDFYRDKLGGHFIAEFDPPGLAFFDVGGVRLMLERNAPKGTLYFRVDDIDAAYDDLKAKGVEFIDQPHLIHRDADGLFGPVGEEEWMAFFNDPSGNLLAIASRRRS
jgi:methylmalonyl-CoA/ethylmalonyl-CoA epimerase